MSAPEEDSNELGDDVVKSGTLPPEAPDTAPVPLSPPLPGGYGSLFAMPMQRRPEGQE